MPPLYPLRLRLLLHSVPSRLLNPSVRLRAHHSSDTSRLVRTLCAHHDPCRPRFASSLATIPRSSSVAVLRLGVGRCQDRRASVATGPAIDRLSSR
ncbi:hypothetical protein IEO21_10537 [Rhodonia placenta]|uniref:Uncharacterized protein n=1 Tax=Rhodonia placenta TaxID=104341 RepID=A0A8H7TXF8_9APHY|nr:hypothetical protein IEO21_10537 [Postia placenta]